MRLKITQIRHLTSRIAEFSLQPLDGSALPDWTAGAHIEVETTAGARSYSLIRWPDAQDGLTIAVQREPDGAGGSAAMHALTEGSEITASMPINDFELIATDRPVLLLAGGIGVTPLISIASDLAAQGRAFVFHYAGRSAADMAYLAEIGEAFPRALTLHFDDETPIDLPALAQVHAGHDCYICGPKGMIEAARTALEGAGVAPDRIHVELFATPEATDDNAFEVEVADTGQVITVAANQTIIAALEAAGLDPIYDCQRGDCGICQTDVIAGTPDHRDVVLSQAEKASGKVMQICVSRAKSARLVLDL